MKVVYRLTKDSTDETPKLVVGVRIRPFGDDKCSGANSGTEPHDKEERDDETNVGPHEYLPWFGIVRHIHVVIARQARPTDGKAKDDPAETQDRCSFRLSDRHGKVNKVFGGDAEENEE